MRRPAGRARPSPAGSTSTSAGAPSSAGVATPSTWSAWRRAPRTTPPRPPSAGVADRSGTLPIVPATVIVGAQWGDEGKGKIVDLLAAESDLVCRYQGGPNAGHTIVVGDEVYKIRAIPSGIIQGKPSAIGAGCVVDPAVLIAELDDLEARGHETAGLV